MKGGEEGGLAVSCESRKCWGRGGGKFGGEWGKRDKDSDGALDLRVYG